jgi:hypothetical protein
MAYSDFNLRRVKEELGIEIVEKLGLFEHLQSIEPSQRLLEILEESVPLALAINTEKARSELILSNVFLELRRLFERKISFFSGIEFNVDRDKGLNGFCDFIISLSPEQLMLDCPIVTIVEAKNENLVAGIGQCIAEMVAAQIQNERDARSLTSVYGTVTSGNTWKFIKIQKTIAFIDLKEYYIDNIGKILSILSAMVKQVA